MRLCLRLVLIIASVLIMMFAATPAKGGPFPFGPYLSWAFIFTSLLMVWCAIRLHSPWERKAVLYGFLSGASLGCVGVVAGVLGGIFLSDKDLTPLVGLFVWGANLLHRWGRCWRIIYSLPKTQNIEKKRGSSLSLVLFGEGVTHRSVRKGVKKES